MNIESITGGQTAFSKTAPFNSSAEQVERNRSSAKQDQNAAASEKANGNQAQSEELLQSIKSLTDNGAYSVRFEMYKDTDDLVINLIEQKSGEVIRQIPPEEILGLRKTLSDLRGNLVQTES